MRPTISFEEDTRLVNQLLDLLKREQINLIKHNMDEIEALIEIKADLLQKINHVAKNRYAALAEKGFESNENGMVSWIHQQSNAVIKEAWDGFQETLMQAKEFNRLNGVLIAKHFNRNQQMLNTLQNTFQSNDVYGKNGQKSATRSVRNALTA